MPCKNNSMLADTGYWLALANPRDPWHGAAVAATRDLTDPLVVTWPVITEASHLLGRIGGVDAQVHFMGVLLSNAVIHHQDQGDLSRIGALMDKYQDLPMDLADASLVAAAAARNDRQILSTDVRDFGIYRWRANEPFENLLPSFRGR